MCWHAWNKMFVISFSLAAAGILTCVAALRDGLVPKGSVLASWTSMAALAVAIIAVVAGYVWACDKCQEYLSGHLDRMVRNASQKPGAEVSSKERLEIRETDQRMQGREEPFTDKPHVLIVDDEKSIRFTLTQALASLPVEIDTAANGEQALTHVDQGKVAVILLDLRMPGMDGMQVLERLRESRPDIPVVIITAHGTVRSAVGATKLGAVEFLVKPFLPHEVRAIVARALAHGNLTESEVADYAACFESAKRCLSQRHAGAAIEHLRKAISISPERPEAYNLLGAIHELRGEMYEALNDYRVAWDFDATYEPSRLNIERATRRDGRGQPIMFGELREASAER